MARGTDGLNFYYLEHHMIYNWQIALRAAIPDVLAGISHAALCGTEEFRLHVTRLEPGTRVKAHRHMEGEELYIIVSGEGLLYTGTVDENAQTDWTEPLAVSPGDTFCIRPKQVHQLHNTGSEPLVLIFGCPDAHLGADRFIVPDYVC